MGRTVVVVGATASGKTRLAAELARELGYEVVNADASQLYAEVAIGVAKPEPRIRALVPHHLFDVASVREKLSAWEYLRRARLVLEELRARGRGAVVVGGTGLYVTALLQGLDEMPEVAAEVRARVRRLVALRGAERAHRLLARVDPVLASRLAPADAQRIGRGLEVAFGTGRRLSELQLRGGLRGEARGPACPAWLIGIRRSRADLALRIVRRVDAMWQEGLLEEARRLAAAGLRADVEAQKPIGYREAFAVLDGRMDVAEAKERTVRQTLALAKRQATWWRRREVAWIDAEPSGEPTVAAAMDLLASLAGGGEPRPPFFDGPPGSC